MAPSSWLSNDAEAWYTPETLARRTVHHGVVATVREHEGERRYETRDPEHLVRPLDGPGDGLNYGVVGRGIRGPVRGTAAPV